jgi:hypothetical protein
MQPERQSSLKTPFVPGETYTYSRSMTEKEAKYEW